MDDPIKISSSNSGAVGNSSNGTVGNSNGAVGNSNGAVKTTVKSSSISNSPRGGGESNSTSATDRPRSSDSRRRTEAVTTAMPSVTADSLKGGNAVGGAGGGEANDGKGVADRRGSMSDDMVDVGVGTGAEGREEVVDPGDGTICSMCKVWDSVVFVHVSGGFV